MKTEIKKGSLVRYLDEFSSSDRIFGVVLNVKGEYLTVEWFDGEGILYTDNKKIIKLVAHSDSWLAKFLKDLHT